MRKWIVFVFLLLSLSMTRAQEIIQWKWEKM